MKDKTTMKQPTTQKNQEMLGNVSQSEPVDNKDGWLQDGGLLYRLTDEKNPENRDEINVTMADGSRSIEARTRRAGELLDRIRSTQKPEPVVSDKAREADAHLHALMRYTEGFYSVAIEHGLKSGPTANAVAHIEKAARALHRLAHTQAQPPSPWIPASSQAPTESDKAPPNDEPVDFDGLEMLVFETDHPSDKEPVELQKAFADGWNKALQVIKYFGPLYTRSRYSSPWIPVTTPPTEDDGPQVLVKFMAGDVVHLVLLPWDFFTVWTGAISWMRIPEGDV